MEPINKEILERNKNINRGFRKLEIWQKSAVLYKLVVEIIDKNKKIPFKTIAQVEDSAFSIASNIAEGYSRRSAKETLRHYEISLGSAAENYSQMYSLLSVGRVNQEDFDKYDTLHYEVENKIITMNKSLITIINNNNIEWKMDYI